MSATESEREDLLREATALVERVELRLPAYAEPIVAGFRHGGSASFYFGGDPVYQFNAAGELRRAYIAGLLYKAERGRLFSLRRERSAAEVVLVRSELGPQQTQQIVADLTAHLATLREALASGGYEVIGQVPVAAPIVTRVQQWLAANVSPVSIARRPHAG